MGLVDSVFLLEEKKNWILETTPSSLKYLLIFDIKKKCRTGDDDDDDVVSLFCIDT